MPVTLRRFTPAALAALLLAVLAGSCAKRVTSVDASYTAPEGTPSADARIILYPDLPNTVFEFDDLLPEGPDPGDTLLAQSEVRAVGAGAIHATILDGTRASGYQALRRESNGGFRVFKDHVLTPSRVWLDSQWEMFNFSDPRPSGFAPPTYVGRGVVSGAVTESSPLTNAGRLTATNIADIVYTGARAPFDTLISMAWQPVPGAAGYWLQVYQFIGGTEGLIRSGIPAPLAVNEVREFFVAYVTAPADSFKIGRDPAQVLARRPLISGIEYLVRVSAVDTEGRLIATTLGDQEVKAGTGSYRRFRLGAVKVMPTRRTP